MNTEFETKVRRILSENADPHDGLAELVHEWIASGMGQKDMLDRFEEFRALLRIEGREADEDSIMDVMDRITGWCSDHQRLFDLHSADFFAEADHE